VKVVQGSFFPLPPRSALERLEINETTGFVWVRMSISGSEPVINGTGTLATITFNVRSAPTHQEKACCELDLYDTLLYDDSMMAIAHDSLGGHYFYGSIQEDPPVDGRLLDLYTQRGGTGQGVSGGTFKMGEIVEIYALLIYNGWPVQRKLVAFAVLDPRNKTILVEVVSTDSEGVARAGFRISSLPENLGTWTIFSTAEVRDETVWDFLTFEVTYGVAPYGPKAVFTETLEEPRVNETVEFDASDSLAGWNGTQTMPITEYRWNFGDGNKTTTSTPTVNHAYTQEGTYYVTLTVYAPGATPETDTAPAQRKEVVYPTPVGGYTVRPDNPTIARPLTFYSTIVAISALAFAVVRRKNPEKEGFTRAIL
jgi:hypothetical protein